MQVAWSHRRHRPENTAAPYHTAWGIGLVLLLVTAARLLLVVVGGGGLSVQEAELWVAGQTPGLGQADGQPLVPLLLALATSLCGDTLVCLRAPGILAIAATGWLVWRLGLLLYDAQVAFWAAVLFVTLPATTLVSMATGPAAFLPVFWGAALYALLRGLKTDRLGWWVGLGLAFGVGLLADVAMALFVPAFVVYALVSPEYHALWRRRGLWLALTVGLGVAAPALWWLATHALPTPVPTPGAGLLFALGQGLVFGPVPFGVMLWVAFHPGGGGGGGGASGPALSGGAGGPLWGASLAEEDNRSADERMRRGYRTRFFLCFLLPVPLLMGAALFGLPVAVEATTAAGVPAALLVASWLLRSGVRGLLLRLSVVAHVAGAGLVFGADRLWLASGGRLPEALDPFAQTRGLETAAAWTGALIAAYPGAHLVFDDPDLLRLMQFHVQPHPLAARLLPRGPLTDEMPGAEATTAAPAPAPTPDGAPVLVITRDPPPDIAVPEGLRDAGFLVVERGPGRWMSLRAFVRPAAGPADPTAGVNEGTAPSTDPADGEGPGAPAGEGSTPNAATQRGRP